MRASRAQHWGESRSRVRLRVATNANVPDRPRLLQFVSRVRWLERLGVVTRRDRLNQHALREGMSVSASAPSKLEERIVR